MHLSPGALKAKRTRETKSHEVGNEREAATVAAVEFKNSCEEEMRGRQ